MDNVRRTEKATRRGEERQKTNAQRTKAQSSMTRKSLDLAGLLISIGKIVRRERAIERLRGRKMMLQSR